MILTLHRRDIYMGILTKITKPSVPQGLTQYSPEGNKETSNDKSIIR